MLTQLIEIEPNYNNLRNKLLQFGMNTEAIRLNANNFITTIESIYYPEKEVTIVLRDNFEIVPAPILLYRNVYNSDFISPIKGYGTLNVLVTYSNKLCYLGFTKKTNSYRAFNIYEDEDKLRDTMLFKLKEVIKLVDVYILKGRENYYDEHFDQIVEVPN